MHEHRWRLCRIYDAKRLIGRDFCDSDVQSDMKTWLFDVVEAAGGMPKIRVHHEGEAKDFAPQEISAALLSKMKETAEAFLDADVTDAVVTVPAYFNDGQRAATQDAGKIAGLKILRIINEPTAAALAYGFDRSRNVKTKVLMYDLGGGTCDVSVLEIHDGNFTVLAVKGDMHLGGQDFNLCLVEYLIQV